MHEGGFDQTQIRHCGVLVRAVWRGAAVIVLGDALPVYMARKCRDTM